MAKRTKKKSTGKTKAPSRRARPRVAGPVTRPHGDHEVELIARGLWLHGSRALLCRNLDKGYLYLPGGHIEFGESAAAALEREFLEECGARVAAAGLLLVTEGAFATKKRWHHEVNLVFRVEPAVSPTARKASGMDPDGQVPPRVTSREKAIGFDWVDLAAAVDLDIRPLSVKAWLAAGAGVDPTAARAEWVSEIPR